ncbi:MAG: aldose epimerase [Myxococcales bacterium]
MLYWGVPRIESTHDVLETLCLLDEASDARATLAPARGGLLTRFSVAGVPVLYMDDATLRDPAQSVRGGIPVLFPIAGKLPNGSYSWQGQTYAMKQHGFARNLPWQILETSADAQAAQVTLGLEASDATRAQYPFEFALRFRYRLSGGRLSLEQRFENRGATPMPIQPGLHPYFYVRDADKAQTRLSSDATRAHDNVTGREIPLSAPIEFEGREVDLHLLDQRAREVVLTRPGLPAIQVAFDDDQGVLVVWSLPGRDFVCVEPWSAKFGALADGSARLLAPGESTETKLVISLVG